MPSTAMTPAVRQPDAVREALADAFAALTAAEIADKGLLPEERDMIVAALAAAPVGDAWQTIDTAPRDREILAVRIEWWTPENGDHRWVANRVRQTRWDAERQRFEFGSEKQPTHWTEVPAIPALPIPRQERGGSDAHHPKEQDPI